LRFVFFFFFQAEDGIRDLTVTGVQTCALPICGAARHRLLSSRIAARRTSPRAPAGQWDRSAPRRRTVFIRPRISAPWATAARSRSEERRVGKEGRARWCRDDEKIKEMRAEYRT